MINSGRLNKVGTLQVQSAQKDAAGQKTLTWEKVATIRFGLEPLRGRELLAAQQYSSEVSHRVVMRFRKNITNKNRILYGERIIDLHHVINVSERGFMLEIGASEGLTNG